MNQAAETRWRPSRPCMDLLAVLALVLSATSSLAQTDADDLATRLGLSDLASYRAALSGRPTAQGVLESGPPPVVSFRELWDHQTRWAGQRVQIEGNVVRVFRQDGFGGFPPLVELWLATKAGDLFCTVFPRGDEKDTAGKAATEPGAHVSFAGTFLKTIRYAAADQARLAPLVVGDRPPLRIRPQVQPGGSEPEARRSRGPAGGFGGTFAPWVKSPSAWWLGLALGLLAAALLAYLQVRPTAVAKRRKTEDQAASEAPLEFIRPEDAHGTAVSDARFS